MAPRHPDLSQAIWRKSTYSSSTGQNCVEVATNLPGIIAVRDSKDPDGPKMLVSLPGWRSFLTHLKDHHVLLDLLPSDQLAERSLFPIALDEYQLIAYPSQHL